MKRPIIYISASFVLLVLGRWLYDIIRHPLPRRINRRGLKLIKEFEGLRLEAYQDPVGIWTIGWGHTADVQPGDKITRLRAAILLRKDIKNAERAVRRVINAPVSANEFSAMVALAYNIGEGNFERSTLARLVNEKKYEEAAEQFPRFRFAQGQELPGLVRRREAEKELFLKKI